ncbi:MAG: hypothetical protein K2F96_05470, partial [Muribaculaceae bacterium]|nr:hypothetical protein [Muribaculaceae bacterium]
RVTHDRASAMRSATANLRKKTISQSNKIKIGKNYTARSSKIREWERGLRFMHAAFPDNFLRRLFVIYKLF